MKLEINLPKFRRPANPFAHEGVKALAIVLGVLMLISGAVYGAKLIPKQKKSVVLPATTEVETSVSPQEPITPEATEGLREIPGMEVGKPSIIPAEAPEATTSSTYQQGSEGFGLPEEQHTGEPTY